MRRREFITLLGGAAARGRSRRARSSRRCRWIGFSSQRSRRPTRRSCLGAFRAGSEEAGLCRGPERRDRIPLGGRPLERLPALAADLVARQVDCDRDRRARRGARGQGSDDDDSDRLRAAAATRSGGLVASLNRPGGNVTGFSLFEHELWREAAGAAARVGAERDDASPFCSNPTIRAPECQSMQARRRAPPGG